MSALSARVVKLEQRIKPGDALNRWVRSLSDDELKAAILDIERQLAESAVSPGAAPA